RLPRQYWFAVQPHRNRAVGIGELQSVSAITSGRTQTKVFVCGRLAGEASGAKLFRRSSLEPLVRLGIPNSAEGSVVFGTRPGAGNFPAGASRARDRQV